MQASHPRRIYEPPQYRATTPRNHNYSPTRNKHPKWFSPCTWSPRTKVLTFPFLLTLVLTLVIITPILTTKNNAIAITHKRNHPSPPKPPTYTLIDTYTGPSFFDKFTFFTEEDPTDGFVEYINPTQSLNLNLTHTTQNTITLRIDTTPSPSSSSSSSSTSKIKSIRIESTPRYTTGLFIFSIHHTPHGCGLWPALWLSDTETWPLNGEIDVIEATNHGNGGNVVSLHTGGNCIMHPSSFTSSLSFGPIPGKETNPKHKRLQTGTPTGNPKGICDVGDSKENILGCGVRGGPETYGEEFNARGGGVYILEIHHESGIKVWMFPMMEVPGDVLANTIDININVNGNGDDRDKYNRGRRGGIVSNPAPNPRTWGPPLAHFPGVNCDIGEHFRNLKIIANIDLCGQNAGHPAVYHDQDGCPGMCEEFVRGNLQEVGEEAYWEFGGFWVFQDVDGGRS